MRLLRAVEGLVMVEAEPVRKEAAMVMEAISANLVSLSFFLLLFFASQSDLQYVSGVNSGLV